MIKLAETLVGLFILAAVAGLFFLAFKVSGVSSYHQGNSYQITAPFDNIGDLKTRAAVTMAGVKIGQVTGITLDNKTYRALVTIRIDKDEPIPDDSAASILTAGLLGANYISLTPGFSDSYLHNGSEITDTHPAIILEDMIGQLLFSMKKDDGKNADDSTSTDVTTTENVAPVTEVAPAAENAAPADMAAPTPQVAPTTETAAPADIAAPVTQVAPTVPVNASATPAAPAAAGAN